MKDAACFSGGAYDSEMAAGSGTIEIGGDSIAFVIERSRARRKTIAIHLERDGSLRVTAPVRTPAAEIEAALALRKAWITRARASAAEIPAPEPILERATLPYLGDEVPAVNGLPSVPEFQLAARGRGQREAGTPSEAAATAALIAWYRAAAGQLLPPQVAHRSALIGHNPTRVVISRQKHAWGSCGRDGEIRLSYRLMMLRPELIDCVIVHEICHLVHHNHSPAFWAEVTRWQPDYKRLRAELKAASFRLPV